MHFPDLFWVELGAPVIFINIPLYFPGALNWKHFLNLQAESEPKGSPYRAGWARTAISHSRLAG